MSENLMEPLEKIQGAGKIEHKGNQIDIVFSLELLKTGRIEGEAIFNIADFIYAYEMFNEVSFFQINGQTIDKQDIEIEKCYALSFNQNNNIMLRFVANEVKINKLSLEIIPKNLVVRFNILNINPTFLVKLDTKIGELFIRPLKEQKTILSKIKSYKISAITSIAEIFIKDNNDTIKIIIEKGIEIIEEFLCISRLADTCYNDWCSLTVYENVEDSDQYKLIYRQISNPKRKIPIYRGITNTAHSTYFYKSAYSGYSNNKNKLNDIYNFNVALEWYLESYIATVIESQFIMLCTCLEFLVQKYQDINNNEFIIRQEEYEQSLHPRFKNEIKTIMQELNLNKEQRSEFYMKLRGLNRRSFSKKIELFLQELKLEYGDLINDINDIVKIRNKVIHEGSYDDMDELIKIYNGLSVLLVRIFLALIEYDDKYYDWVKGDWVDFKRFIK